MNKIEESSTVDESESLSSSSLTMQDAVLALQSYWTDLGCMIAQPFNTEVGAGTANPATALRVLGPEPWRVGYVEPSVRPDDARYGENPNRLQTHTQFQVILKPEPGNPQELYLRSLEALGVDIRQHDIRFIEDNWASPALGAWGLGWEVWLDGLEITQFTYFQQAGGIMLDPVSVEITYGLERILMALQGVNHFKDIEYAPGISYGEVFGQSEYEMSRYYLDDADIATNQALFDHYASEAQRMLDLKLPVPAYLYALKCSHTFNVLDARGAISTTERAKAFGRMRVLTRSAATLWVERRAELGHPLGVPAPLSPATASPAPAEATTAGTLLFEIGVEELPHTEVQRLADVVRESVVAKLADTRLDHGDIAVSSTPRRIVVTVAGVEPRERESQKTVRGPRANVAHDATGAPTPALQGFARKQGVDVADVKIITVDGVDYVAVEKTEESRSAVDVLAPLLAATVTELRSERNMRWRDPALSLARPIRWLLALLDGAPIPVTVSSLASGTTTRVHRTAETPTVEVASSDGYEAFLEQHNIILDRSRRRDMVVRGAQALAATVGGTVDLDTYEALIDEITDIVEYPSPLLGSFDERYLELPSSILTTVMRKHQRYLPVYRDGKLLPYFVTVANGDCDHAVVRTGNEAVLRARYEDAAFFWRADLKVTPEQHKTGLAKLTFEERLGSVAERANRIAGVAAALADIANLDEADRATLKRASQLAKFDLASQMVIELSSLAGTMAREYALRSGEMPEVAQALAEMEQPRNAGDALPASKPGALLALADRMDLLAGLFAIGATPTGSSDPFGLRRAAVGVVNILRAFPSLSGLSVQAGIETAVQQLASQGITVAAEAVTGAVELVARRYEQQLLDAGHEHRLVQAVMPWATTPARADRTLETLEKHVSNSDFAELAAAIQRVVRILPDNWTTPAEMSQLTSPAETSLHAAVDQVAADMRGHEGDFDHFLTVAGTLPPAINQFFEDTLVMDPDASVRAARLELLSRIKSLTSSVLDWRMI
jgi:glycyl-tRNA synthetase